MEVTVLDGWPDAIRAAAEAVIAVCAAYAAYRSRANATLTQDVQKELAVNPQKTVDEMVRQNGGLSGVFPKCGYQPPTLEPGESPPRRGM